MSKTEDSTRRGRPAKGSLYSTKSGWRARMTVTIDGERVQRSFDLGTKDKTVARIKMRRLLNSGAGEDAAAKASEAYRPETCADAIERVIEAQRVEGMASAPDRLSRLRRYAVPYIGHLSVDQVRAGQVRETLEHAGAAGLSKISVNHLKNDLSSVFGSLWRDELIAENPMARVRLPRGLREDRRARVVLIDSEFVALVESGATPSWLRMMAIVSRSFGGMRTSDLHAWDWLHVDTVTWETAAVYRPKTDRLKRETELTRLVIPRMLLDPLRAWWRDAGKPTAGPVFPALDPGPSQKTPKAKGKRSYARELRVALWDAGIHRPLEGFDDALAELRRLEAELSDGAKGQLWRLRREVQAARKKAKDRDAIQSDTDTTRKADFHSFRRAFATALASSGTNAQQAMALAGHRSAQTHLRYVRIADHALVTPEGALPRISAWPMQEMATVEHVAESQSPRKPNDFQGLMSGDPNEIRTRVAGVRGELLGAQTSLKQLKTAQNYQTENTHFSRLEDPHAESPCLKSDALTGREQAIVEAMSQLPQERQRVVLAEVARCLDGCTDLAIVEADHGD